jgi:hypothetical protein
MKKISLTLLLFLLFTIQVLAQCTEGDNKPIDSIPTMRDSHPTDSTDIPVTVPIDLNEIIGIKGYDARGDALQWMAAKASLLYTSILILQENVIIE